MVQGPIHCNAAGLDVSNNFLSGNLQTIAWPYHARYLNLAGNQFVSLLPQFQKAHSLSILNLEKNQLFGPIHVSVLRLPSLLSVKLKQNDFTTMMH